MKVSQLVRASVLLDFYGGVLTDNQRQIASSYLNFNASLAEIAEQTNTTRQAVGDCLRRTLKRLEELETKLHLYEKYENILKKIPVISKKVVKEPKIQEAIEREFIQLLKTLEE